MNIVAIETATETVGVAVRTGAGVEADFSLAGRRRHVESLVPALEHLLGQVGLDVADLGAVAVDVGPGLFTGLRVGIATAKGLAQSLGIGIVGLSSLDILHAAAGDLGHHGLVLAVVDARRGEVFASLRQIGAPGAESVEVIPPGVLPPADLAAMLATLGGVPVVAVGDGAQRYADGLEDIPGVACIRAALTCPPAPTLLSMALRLLGDGATPVSAQEIVPLYMREADAKSNFAQIERPGAALPTGPG